MSSFLFDDFPKISEKQWKQKIQFDLQGVDYNKTLLTHTQSGISIKPIYHQDSYQQLKFTSPKINFNICQTIFIGDVSIANSIAKKALKNGATSILFIASKSFNIQTILKGIDKNTILQFQFHFLSQSFVQELILQTTAFKIFLNIDIIGNLCKTGNWYKTIHKDFEIFGTINELIKPNSTVACIRSDHYQNAGATIVQQIAYALAHGNEYLNTTHKTLNMNACFAIGSNYFFEIAKIRAFRYLWNILTVDAGIKSELHITAFPTKRNKTLYDYNTNMLRTTSECMSAILGGANTVCNLSYDALYHKSNEFGERISRNQLLILKNESSFENVNNASNGSFYIEAITKEIAEKALNLFKDIEKNGGFLKQLKEGTIQRKIAESAKKEQNQFDANDIILVGTNKYLNESDKMKEELELYPFMKTNIVKTLITPILPKRLAETVEQTRLKNEA